MMMTIRSSEGIESPEKARDPSCHQQRSDAGAAGGCRVDDEGVGGRDELANRCGGDVGGSGETPVIAVLLFQGSEHAADGGCRGDAGSGEGAEQRVARDVGQGEGSRDLSHHQHCQVDDPLGDAAVGHQGACQDEERHRKEGEGVNSCDQLLGGDEHAEGRAQEHDDGDQRGNTMRRTMPACSSMGSYLSFLLVPRRARRLPAILGMLYSTIRLPQIGTPM